MTPGMSGPERKRPPIMLLVAGLLALSAGADARSDTPAALLKVREQAPYGRYITDREGHSLYLFANDTQGGESTCTEVCANAWPPYTTSQPPEAGEGIAEDRLGTVQREDGTIQVTYGGWPLYYFNGDKQPGDALGQNIEHLGAHWYLVSPRGEQITRGGRREAPDLETPPGQGEDPASQGQEVHEKIMDNPGQADDA